MLGQIFAIALLFAVSVLAWSVSLSKRARKTAVQLLYWQRWPGGVPVRATREDAESLEAVLTGLGVVFGLALDILAVFAVVELFKG